jgi:inorganic pyrophosphatase
MRALRVLFAALTMLLCVPVAAPRDAQIERLQDVSKRELDEISHFFLAVVALANKDARVLG